MSEKLLNYEAFFEKYNIQKNSFEKTGLEWTILEQIYTDHVKMRIKSRIKYSKILGSTLRTLRLCGRLISRKGAKFAKKGLKNHLKFQLLIHI